MHFSYQGSSTIEYQLSLEHFVRELFEDLYEPFLWDEAQSVGALLKPQVVIIFEDGRELGLSIASARIPPYELFYRVSTFISENGLPAKLGTRFQRVSPLHERVLKTSVGELHLYETEASYYLKPQGISHAEPSAIKCSLMILMESLEAPVVLAIRDSDDLNRSLVVKSVSGGVMSANVEKELSLSEFPIQVVFGELVLPIAHLENLATGDELEFEVSGQDEVFLQVGGNLLAKAKLRWREGGVNLEILEKYQDQES